MWGVSLRVPAQRRRQEEGPHLAQVLSDSSYPLGANLGHKKSLAEAGAWAQRGSRKEPRRIISGSVSSFVQRKLRTWRFSTIGHGPRLMQSVVLSSEDGLHAS